MPTIPFYHREQQLADLNQLIRSDGPAFVLVYGRRRVRQNVPFAALGREFRLALFLLDGAAHYR